MQMPAGPVTTTAEVEDLKRFLATAPQMWTKPDDPPLRSYPLSNGEHVSCVFWRGKFFITGTDIVKILLFRFAQIGRPVLNVKKFEEGVFSDLRNLKPGTEAILEEPRSEFLEFLFRHGCIRTQKKQKVFFWNCVPHESLFLDAIERDFKREGSLYHMNMMMNHTRYLQKQVAMMQQQQAAVANYSGTATPNSAAMAQNYLMTQAPGQRVPMPAANFMGNTVDPFLLQPATQQQPQQQQQQQATQARPSGKMPINLQNGAMPFMPPMPQPQPTINAAPSQFLPNSDDCLLGSTEDPFMLNSYFSSTGEATTDPIIDPSFLMNLHEYWLRNLGRLLLFACFVLKKIVLLDTELWNK